MKGFLRLSFKKHILFCNILECLQLISWQGDTWPAEGDARALMGSTQSSVMEACDPECTIF
jgi:glutamine cyclotransferase